MHCEPLEEQRAHNGCSLLHFTFEAAQASHEARSFGFRSVAVVDGLGADVGERTGGVEEGHSVNGECQSWVEGGKDIVEVE